MSEFETRQMIVDCVIQWGGIQTHSNGDVTTLGVFNNRFEAEETSDHLNHVRLAA